MSTLFMPTVLSNCCATNVTALGQPTVRVPGTHRADSRGDGHLSLYLLGHPLQVQPHHSRTHIGRVSVSLGGSTRH